MAKFTLPLHYAMYDAARAAILHLTPEQDLTTERTHNGLIAAFGLHLVKTGLVDVSLGRNLNRAQTLRQLADYTGEAVSSDDVQLLIVNTDQFVQTISTLIEG